MCHEKSALPQIGSRRGLRYVPICLENCLTSKQCDGCTTSRGDDDGDGDGDGETDHTSRPRRPHGGE